MASTSTSGSKGKEKLEYPFCGMAPSSLPSLPKSTKKPSYDVIINHRGKDVKSTLASNLYTMLTEKELSAFLDERELEYGGFFPQALLSAMNSALVHIAIFSENYAESPWCLAELSHMLKSRATVIPIFYNVDPSDLRHINQGKGSYVKAFNEYEEKHRYLERLDEWKTALYQVSYCKGADIKNKEDVNRQLKDIVDMVLKIKRKNEPLKVADHPVGMEDLVEKFEKKIIQSVEGDQGVGVIGIWGMGGLGKTTLAKELYNRKSSLFHCCSFVYNVRDGGLFEKQKKMMRDIGLVGEIGNIEEGKEKLSSYLRSVNALIVLDDVDHLDQLDALLPRKDRFACGSLVIVTTRDHNVVHSWCVSSNIYPMEALNPLDASKLFCWYAFGQHSPWDGFEELVEEVVKACHGVPLSLKVIGRELCKEPNKQCWESLLHKMKTILPPYIQRTLKISYDTLDDQEKEMFLDVACFFIGEERNLVIELWDGLDWSGYIGLKRLVSKCLIELDDKGLLCMHDHIRDMGRDIARKQWPFRIGLHQPIINVRNQEKENGNGIHGIVATPDRIKWIGFWGIEKTVPEMELEDGDVDDFRVWYSDREFKLKTNRETWSLSYSSIIGLKYLVISGNSFNQEMGKLSELVWLRWFKIGQSKLPPGLSLQKLRVLELYESKLTEEEEHHLEELWEESDGKVPVQLREITISNCVKFKGLPKSIGLLNHLKKLIVSGTNGYKITSLPDEFCFLRSLEHLVLDDCKMQSLPNNFGNLSSLRHLSLFDCKDLRRLPGSFKNLTLLEYLDLSGCRQLTFTPDDLNILENITKLEFLSLRGCKQVKELPRHMRNQVSLRELDFIGTSVMEIPDNIVQLSRLELMGITAVSSISLPASLAGLSSLKELQIDSFPEPDLYDTVDKVMRLLDSLRGLSNSWENPSIEHCPYTGTISFGSSNLEDIVWKQKFRGYHWGPSILVGSNNLEISFEAEEVQDTMLE